MFALSFPSSSETFRKYGELFLVGPNPVAIAAADLNTDGLPEIVTANPGRLGNPKQERPANDELSLLFATGNLKYIAEPPLRADFAPYAIAIGKVATLKAPDIVAASFLAARHRDLALFRNVGDKVFESRYFTVADEKTKYCRMYDADDVPVFTSPGLTSIALADVDRDGYRDAVATGWSSDILVYFPGLAETFFADPVQIPASGGPRDVRIADLDGDGNLDLAVALYVAGAVGLWKGDKTGKFEQATQFSSRGRLPTKIGVADINGDGKPDLAVSHCYADDSIVLFYGDGNFKFSLSQEICLGKDHKVLEHEIRDLVVADFNGDGKTDLAAACFGSRQVAILLNVSEDSGIPQRFAEETCAFENGRPRAICTADFNSDGAPDIAAALWDANAVALLLSTPKPEPKKK